MTVPRIVVLQPDLHPRIWGGNHLPAMYDAAREPGSDPFGEAWLAHVDSTIASGPMKGERLTTLLASAPEVWGTRGEPLPVLIKILDAAQPLSIQVHPNDAYAALRHPDRRDTGKTESWRIMACKEDAFVYWSFVRDVTPDEVREAVHEHTLPSLLRKRAVEPGDVIHNPAGTVHAVGAGIVLFEVQQPSDLTYRLYDFGRLGLDGRPRELHLEDSLAVMTASGAAPSPLQTESVDSPWMNRVTCAYYGLDEVILDGFCHAKTDGQALHVITPIDGSALISWDGEQLEVPKGWSAVIAAHAGSYALEGSGLVMRVRAPVLGNG